jgi:hypothetical protein
MAARKLGGAQHTASRGAEGALSKPKLDGCLTKLDGRLTKNARILRGVYASVVRLLWFG